MSNENDIQSENIVSAEIASIQDLTIDPATGDAWPDPTAGAIDPTNPDARSGIKGHGKRSASNGGRGGAA